MSLKNKKKEIQRLVTAFEAEVTKLHDIKFSTLLFSPNEPVDDRRFETNNHAVMLWQYYGRIDNNGGAEKFVESLKKSNLKWGVADAELTSFGVIEGQACDRFVVMAQRAGGIFSEKDKAVLKSRVLSDILDLEKGVGHKTVGVTNDGSLATWLNYLLYYISRTNPGKERTSRIEPDLFYLSLLALESLLEEPNLGKVDKSLRRIEDIKFKVALSFPDEKRGFVSEVAGALTKELGKDEVFYDLYYQSQLAKPNLDVLLQRIYKEKSGLIVVFLCKEYSEKEWCGLEWRVVRELIKAKADDQVMFVRFDGAELDGFLSIDGYIDGSRFSESQVAEYILERVALLESM